MARNVENSVTLMDDFIVPLFPEHNDCDLNSFDQKSDTYNGNAKMRLHQSDSTTTFTKRYFYYLLAFGVFILIIVLINLIVSSVGVHRINQVQAEPAAPSVEVADLIHEIQFNWRNYTSDSTEDIFLYPTTKTYLNSESVEHMPNDCTFAWVKHIPGELPSNRISMAHSTFMVVRVNHLDGYIPGEAGTYVQEASYVYNNTKYDSPIYQIFTASSYSCYKWVVTNTLKILPSNAVSGGMEPGTGEVLYICAVTDMDMIIYFGWVKKNESICVIPTNGDKKVSQYKVLTST